MQNAGTELPTGWLTKRIGLHCLGGAKEKKTSEAKKGHKTKIIKIQTLNTFVGSKYKIRFITLFDFLFLYKNLIFKCK